MNPPRKLPLHQHHVRLGARFAAFAGWDMPLWYAGAVAEHKAVRQSAGVFDVSHMGRTWVTGAEAAAALSSVLTRDITCLECGASAYGLACTDEGGIIDDLIVYHVAPERFLVISNAANIDKVRGVIDAGCADLSAIAADASAATVLLAVQGPRAPGLLAQVLDRSLPDIGRRRCAERDVKGETYFASRTGYTGEDGFEVMTSVDAGGLLLDRLAEADCRPCGLAARDSLRLEAALPLHGSDIDESTTPWEAGLGWAVEIEHDFRGREALAASKDAAVRRLACLIADREGIFRHGCAVYHNAEAVSVITSGGFSPVLGRSIAMAYLPRPLAREGTELSVDVRGRMVAAHVVKRPFYRPPHESG